MKSIFKKIAFVLALAMIVTTFPAQSASAASKPSVKAKRTLYIGGDTQEQYSNKGWASVKNKGDYTVKFASDNEDVVTVIERNGRLTAVSVGTANVTATFTKGKTVVKSTCVVTVKQNALSAGVNADSAKKLAELTVGDELTLVPTKTGLDADEKMITVEDPDKKVFTNGIRFKSSNEEVFTVDSKTGELKAVKEGEAKLTVYGIQWEYDKEKAKWTTTRINGSETEYDVVVKVGVPTVKDAKLISTTRIELSVENVTAENVKDLKITNEFGGDVKNIFKDPVLSEDKKTVVLEKYVSLTNGEKLNFAFGDQKAVELAVVIGEPANIVLVGPATSVVNGEGTKIEYKVLDANGIELAVTPDNITFKTDDQTFSYVDATEGKIYIYQVGKTVTLEATYNTGKFDTNWNPIVLTSNRIQVTGVDQAAVVPGTIQYSLHDGDYGTNAVNIYEGSGDKSLHAKIVMSDKTEYTKAKDGSYFTFETLDPSVLLVDAASGNLAPVKAGTARILVKFDNGSVKMNGIATVVVRPNANITRVEVDNQMATISNMANVETAYFNFTAKDQYGDKVEGANITKIESLSRPNGVDADTAVGYLNGMGTTQASFVGNGQTAGNYTYRVWFSDNVSIVVTVALRKPATDDITKASSYKFVAVDNNNITVDVNNGDALNGASAFRFKVVAQDGAGVAIGVVTDSSVLKEIAVKNGNTSATSVSAADGNGIFTASFVEATAASGSAVSGSAVTADNANDSVVVDGVGYKVQEGTFTITGKYGTTNRNIIPTTVSISIKKNAPSIKVKTAAITSSEAGYKADIMAQLEVSNADTYTVLALGDTVNNITQTGTSFVLVKTVKVAEKIGNNYVIHTVNLNQYFSVTLQ